MSKRLEDSDTHRLNSSNGGSEEGKEKRKSKDSGSTKGSRWDQREVGADRRGCGQIQLGKSSHWH